MMESTCPHNQASIVCVADTASRHQQNSRLLGVTFQSHKRDLKEWYCYLKEVMREMMILHWSRLLQQASHEWELLRREYDIRVYSSHLFQDSLCNDYAQSENREIEGWWEFGINAWSVSCFEFFVQLLWSDRVWSDELTKVRNRSDNNGTIKRDREKEVIESITLGREVSNKSLELIPLRNPARV